MAYGAAAVLSDVSITVAPRALVGILGPNGSGKTTLLRVMNGAVRPQAGRVRLGDQDITAIARKTMARRMAVVPQETHLAFDYSVIEIVLMGRYAHLGAFEIEGPDDLASAHAALEATGTDSLAERPFHTLSGGEKQRVVIASALAQLDARGGQSGEKARVLLLDEPTSSLDVKFQLEVAAILGRLHEDQEITIVLSTHDLRFAKAVCTDVVLLRGGRVLAAGAPVDVLTPPAVADLYGIRADQAAGLVGPV